VTVFMPSSVEGDFRKGAVDGDGIGGGEEDKYREVGGEEKKLKKVDVAERIVKSVDWGERNVFMPWVSPEFSLLLTSPISYLTIPQTMRFGHLLYWIFPRFVEWRASIKYRFTP
jgi:hypothetical protein